MIVIGYGDGKKDSSQRTVDLWNEVTIMLLLYCTLCYSPFVPDIEVKFNIGYLSGIIIISHLIINLVFITINTIKLLIVAIKRQYAIGHMLIWRFRYHR